MKKPTILESFDGYSENPLWAERIKTPYGEISGEVDSDLDPGILTATVMDSDREIFERKEFSNFDAAVNWATKRIWKLCDNHTWD